MSHSKRSTMHNTHMSGQMKQKLCSCTMHHILSSSLMKPCLMTARATRTGDPQEKVCAPDTSASLCPRLVNRRSSVPGDPQDTEQVEPPARWTGVWSSSLHAVPLGRAGASFIPCSPDRERGCVTPTVTMLSNASRDAGRDGVGSMPSLCFPL